MAVKLITFKTNQTVIGDDSTPSHRKLADKIQLKKPVQIIVQPTQNGPMMGFSPFLEFAKEWSTGVEFDLADILCETTPEVELENKYNEVFGVGIQVVSSLKG